MSYNNSYYSDNLQRSLVDANKAPEKQLLLRMGQNPEVVPATMFYPQEKSNSRARMKDPSHTMERQSLLGPGPVKLSPSWEEKNLPNDELNFRNLSIEDELVDGKPPHDRFKLVYLILMLHGIGTLMPWNMFITAKLYFKDYKLNPGTTDADTEHYRQNFMFYLGLASQIPNLMFNVLNLFVQIGGNLTTRIIISILVEVVIFIGTVILAMLDTSTWPVIFFWTTMASVVLLNMANGIYQNSVFGIAANLPMKYSNAVILGSNISGTITALINIIAIAMSPNIRTAAIYYFITALFVLLTCFDTYFALPLLRFYRYYDKQAEKQKKAAQSINSVPRIPYWYIFKKSFPQLWNVFYTFFVTLTIFPAVHSEIQRYDPNFVIPDKYYTAITCFLVFNLFSMIGNIFPMFIRRPGPRWLFIPVLLRTLLIPAFVLCNYKPDGRTRILPILIYNDWAFFGLGVTLGLTNGYFSSLGMMYTPKSVEPQYAPIAGMMGAAALILGIVCGLNFSMVIPIFVENITFPQPEWM